MKKNMNEIKRVISIVTILIFAGVCVMLYCEWQGNLVDTLYLCQKPIGVIPIFAILIGMAHYEAGKGISTREYIIQMFRGKTSSGGRKIYLDYARVLAAIMVILTHACSKQLDTEHTLWVTNLLTVCTGIGLVCNPLYVMISGALLLADEKEESLGKFYFRRFVKVMLPMMIYYIIFMCLSGEISLLPPRNLKEGMLKIITGASGWVPHFWLIYKLISLYIVAPFIRVFVRNLKDSHITFLFFLIIAEEILATYLPLAGIQTSFVFNFAKWEGVFILGYIITKRRTKLIEGFVILFGYLSAVGLSVALINDISLKNYVCNTAPTMVLFAGAILITLSKMEHILKGKFDNPIQILSKYSYSIILVHWYALFAVTWSKMGIRPELFGCVGGIILTVFVSMIVCFIMGFIADNTVVLVLQYLINSFVKRVCNRKTIYYLKKE